MTSLKLFNAVLASEGAAPTAAHRAAEIAAHYRAENLSGAQLNRTFHQSWETIQRSPRSELLRHQMLHYLTTYGFAELGIETDFVYFPPEVSELPAVRRAPVRVIHGLTADELAARCRGLLNSGVALAGETLHDLMDLLEEIDRVPTDGGGVRNREFAILLADRHAVYPAAPAEFLRYLVYRATGSTLLIKNPETFAAIRESGLDIAPLVEAYGPARCARVFRRFKPLWLAFKRAAAPNVRTVNYLAKLAATHHRPLPPDYLNGVTADDAFRPEELNAALEGASAFRKIRLLYALHTRIAQGPFRMYRIRNGTSYTVPRPADVHRLDAWRRAYELVLASLVGGLAVRGQTFRFSPGVEYALPATEKMYVGNFPVGTSVSVAGGLTVGIYWENDWGASDLDLSATALTKVGWDADYHHGGVTYSGDITDAHSGAAELLRFGREVDQPHLVQVSVYQGKVNAGFKLFAGQSAAVKENFLLRPDELRAEIRMQTSRHRQIIGLLVPGRAGAGHRFVFCNVGAGSARVAGVDQAPRLALYDQFRSAPRLRDLLTAAGATVTTDATAPADHDLRWEALTRDSILRLLSSPP